MARLKVLVIDAPAGCEAPGLPLQSLKRQAGVLLPALLADLHALSGVEVMPVLKLQIGLGRGGAEAGSGVANISALEGVAEGASAYRATFLAGKAVEDASPLPQQGLAPEAEHFGTRFDACLRDADAVWPLAFESDGWLACLSRQVLRGKRLLLGSAPGAVEVTSSKLGLTRVLAEAGVATVATYSPHAALPNEGGAWVVKPDDGAGCLHTLLFSDRGEALAWMRASAADGYVLQPFVAGTPGSLSLLCRDGVAQVLSCNRQRVAMRDNRFHVLGTVVNGLADSDGALARLAQQVAAAIPSLWGYVGVDFVLTSQGAVVLDVNPRLTAAYAGLWASIDCNPAALVLDLLQEPVAMPASPEIRRPVNVDIGLA